MKVSGIVSGLALAATVSADLHIPRGFTFNFASIIQAIQSSALAKASSAAKATSTSPAASSAKATSTSAFLFNVPTLTVTNKASTGAAGTTSSASVVSTVTSVTGYGNAPSVIPSLSTAQATATVLPSNSTSGDASTNALLTNSAAHRGNWLPGFDINTDYTTTWPTTGNTVSYNFVIQNVTLSPDGSPKQMLTVNGQFPGPQIEANWGDFIQVTVTNNMKNNGTGIHWHGMRQLNTNTQDGVNGVTECPIAPGDTKTYLFQATQYGTSWYHSHFSVQYGDGVIGPILIHGPASADYDIDLGVVIINEAYPLTAFQEDWFAHRFGSPTSSNYLLNGQNAKPDGSAGKRPTWSFTPGKKHLIRLVNAGVDSHYKVQIDNHVMQVISNDFVPIIPYNTTELSIGIGERYEVVVTANQPSTSYWFRAMAAAFCTFTQNDGKGTANGIISYSNSTSTLLPTSTYGNHSDACIDEPIASLVPVVAKNVDSSSFASIASTLPVGIEQLVQTDGRLFQWTLGGISQSIDWSNPTLSQAVILNNTYTAEKHVIQLTTPNIWTYWIIQNQFFVPHPFHLHGHDFSLLGQGVGQFNPSTDAGKLTFKNPPRRDVAMLVAGGWTVIAFQTDNPGAWLMHCHIAWHAGEGLSLQFLERPADIPALYKTQVQGSQFTQQCADWNTYYPTSVWKKSDSGLKKRTLANGMEVVELTKLPERSEAAKRHVVQAHGHIRRSRNFRRM